MREVNMKLTVNDLNKMRNSAWDIYQRYQAMIGQLNDDIEQLESKFNEIFVRWVLTIQTCGKSLKTNTRE